MKYLPVFVWLLSMAIAFPSFSQPGPNIPDIVLRGFHTEFSSVSKAAWTLEKDSTYRVAFSLANNRHRYIAKFDSSGNWMEKKIGIEFSQLPMSVMEEIVRKFEHFKPVSSSRFETPGNKPVYHVILVKWTPGLECRETYSLELSPEGELLKEPEMQLARVVREG